MEKISLTQFKKETYHEPMKYKFYKKDGGVKEFETERFYFNKDYRLKMISMPKFMLGFEGEMFKIDDKNYLWVSECGKTEFTLKGVEE